MAEIVNMPKLGFDMAEGTLVRWLKKVGETVNKGEVLAEIETDKATVEVESLASGVVRKLLVDEGAVVPVNTPIAVVGSVDEKIEELVVQVQGNVQPKTETIASVPKNSPVVQPVPITQEGKVHAISPLARRMALEKQLDLSTVKGTGPGGRVVRRDIDALLVGQISPGSGKTASVLQSLNDSPANLSDQSLPISKLRAAIGRRMTEFKDEHPALLCDP